MTETHLIVGTTGSGKTALAVLLSKLQPAMVISADSRQVYQGMDIVTGKDHPTNLEMYGINLIPPDAEFSVSNWYDAVSQKITFALDNDINLIIAGGTGLYFRALTDGIATLSIPPNPTLRTELSSLTVPDLAAKLTQLDHNRFKQMNHSDQNNPRRLIRAIEVATSTSRSSTPPLLSHTHPLIGLYYRDLDLQRKVIRNRVLSRLENGAVSEAKKLFSLYPSTLASLSAIGYPQLYQYIKGKCTLDELTNAWVNQELSYAKRQLTYFNSPYVTWYDRGRMTVEEIYEHIQS